MSANGVLEKATRLDRKAYLEENNLVCRIAQLIGELVKLEKVPVNVRKEKLDELLRAKGALLVEAGKLVQSERLEAVTEQLKSAAKKVEKNSRASE